MDLIAKGLTYKPEDEFHLNDVSFGMQKGELYTILGRTLSGKTTLLKTIAGLITPEGGRMMLDDQDLGQVPLGTQHCDGLSAVHQLSAFDRFRKCRLSATPAEDG